jgi:predicted DCC family thiol-disulfide oxidoreductase YuxK
MLVAGRVGVAPAAPEHPTLIFDGECGFCRRWVRRLRRLDRTGDLRYLPLQESKATDAAACPRSQLRQAVHFVGSDGAVHAGASAVREAFRYLRGGGIVRAIFGVPGVMLLAERGYVWVARCWGPLPGRGTPREDAPHRREGTSTPASGDQR